MFDAGGLAADGYAIVPDLLEPGIIAAFEETMRVVGEAGLARKGIAQRAPDALADLLTAGPAFRKVLFPYLKNLRIVQEMAHRVTVRLEAQGFFESAGLVAPVAYHNLRADPPAETTYLLPMHQDFATACARAFRVWVPLRDANPQAGTLAVLPGSHAKGPIAHDESDPAHTRVPEEVCARFERVTIEVPKGTGVILDPLIVHSSVPATGDRVKYVLLVNIQDLTTLADPDDPFDPLPERLRVAERRDRARG